MTDLKSRRKALRRAIKKVGTQQQFAKKLGIRQSNVSSWLFITKDATAPKYVLAIEKLTGVPRYELRPDLYPPEEYSLPPSTSAGRKRLADFLRVK